MKKYKKRVRQLVRDVFPHLRFNQQLLIIKALCTDNYSETVTMPEVQEWVAVNCTQIVAHTAKEPRK